ncbi:MAG: aminoacyl-tRNA hydrolase [Actinomycetaceae bacterium]|nr:aminoacyl-tRNA hydrolase [Actinomycetaceae bacterium]
MYAVVGLGNPGAKYASTRHNVGQMVIDLLASRAGGKLSPLKNTRTLAMAAHLGPPPSARVVLGISTGYMNESGGPVKALLGYFKIAAEDLLVVHDELDLPFGTLRLKRGGGEGGHNGLKSISQALGTKDYMRLRVGVGRPTGGREASDYVLSGFAGAERSELPIVLEEAGDAAEEVVALGLQAAQLRLHSPG